MDRLISEKEVLDVIASWFESVEQQRILQGRIKAILPEDEDEWVRRSDVLRVIDKCVDERLSEPKWISVSERLPEEDGCYLVTTTGTNNNIIDIAYYTEGIWHKASKIKAWMPLPKRYEPQESEG